MVHTPLCSVNRRSGRFLFRTIPGLPLVAVALTGGSLAFVASAQETSSEVRREQWSQAVEQGLKYLATEGQAEDGTFSGETGSGLTALAITAALRNGKTIDDPMVARGLKALEGYVKPDGGIYGNSRLKNYETCIAMMCFSEANRDGRYDETLQGAKKFVTELQYGTGAARDPSDPWYGGVGYAGAGRPDLSNTSYLIEALQSVDTAADAEAIQRAIAFVSRCQNLDSKHNDTQFAGLVNDGGFYYEIPREKIDPSTSEERYTENGGLRSYGSMTYAGLKSMIYAGLTPEDPRVQAAVKWIQDHYSVQRNPGMGTAGLFYYYHTFAAALDVAGLKQVEDAEGKPRNWRADLVSALAEQQRPDGSWYNDNSRWLENNKNLATSFALLALAHCRPEDRAAVDSKR